jgi:hypothetical protein
MSARSPRESAQLAVLNKAVAQDRDTLAQIDEDHHIHGTLTREDHELLALPLAASITELERRIDELFPCADDPWSLISLADLRSDFANAGVVQRRELLRFALDEVWVSQGIRGQRFDDGARLAFVWATSPPTVTGDNDLLVAAAKQRIGARRS